MDKKWIFRTIFSALILFSSFAFWFFLENSLSSGGDWWQKTIWPLIFFLSLTVIFGLYALLESERKFLFLAIFFTLAPFFLFAKIRPSLAWSLLAIFFLANGLFRAWVEKNRTIDLDLIAIFKKSVAASVSALVLLAALIFYWTPYVQSFSASVEVPRPIFDTLTSQLTKALGGPESLPPAQSLSKKQQLEMARQQNEVYSVVNQQLENWLQPIKKFIPAGLALSVFFTLKFLGLFLAWPAIWLAWLVFKILLLTGIVKLERIPVEKEIIKI